MSRHRDMVLECKVYVGDLHRDAQEYEIEKEFSRFGSVRKVWVARNPPGFAFVEFDDPRDADDAVKELDGRNICGSRVRVEHSSGKVRPKPWGRGPSPRRGPPPSRARPFDPNDRCYQCGERGHYAYDCRRSSRRRSRSRSYGRRSRSRSRGRYRSRSYSRSRSPSRGRYTRSPSPKRGRTRSYTRSRSRSPVANGD